MQYEARRPSGPSGSALTVIAVRDVRRPVGQRLDAQHRGVQPGEAGAVDPGRGRLDHPVAAHVGAARLGGEVDEGAVEHPEPGGRAGHRVRQPLHHGEQHVQVGQHQAVAWSTTQQVPKKSLPVGCAGSTRPIAAIALASSAPAPVERLGPGRGERLPGVDGAAADQQARPGAVGAHHGLQRVHLVGRQRGVGVVVEASRGPVGGAQQHVERPAEVSGRRRPAALGQPPCRLLDPAGDLGRAGRRRLLDRHRLERRPRPRRPGSAP